VRRNRVGGWKRRLSRRASPSTILRACSLPKTYQPVEIVSPPFTSASTIKESWIPKSAANVAQTDKPEVPAGFRQVPPSPTFN
jgi:hypothetical protein